jgi:aminotransferase
MQRFVSRHLEGLVQSDIRRMCRECERLGGINLAMGSCDLPTPELVRDPAIAAISAQQSSYTFPEGAAPLRQAIAGKLRRHNNLTADPAAEIVVTVGSAGGFAATMIALFDPGDGVMVMEPYYGYHVNVLLTAGLEPHFLQLGEPPGFELREDDLRRALRPNTRAIVVCTPANPTGKIFSREELEAVARVAADHDLLVVTDEIYEHIRFDGRPQLSPAAVAGLAERTVTIMGLSKAFSVTGWRLGYVFAPPALARAITLINDLYYVCAPTPLQYGVIAGLEAPDSYFETLQAVLQQKRDLLCAALADAGLCPIVPQGALYVLADIRDLGFAGSRQAAMQLLEEVGVAAAPGTDFYRGAAGDAVLRFCFAKNDAVLAAACERLRRFRVPARAAAAAAAGAAG